MNQRFRIIAGCTKSHVMIKILIKAVKNHVIGLTVIVYCIAASGHNYADCRVVRRVPNFYNLQAVIAKFLQAVIAHYHFFYAIFVDVGPPM